MTLKNPGKPPYEIGERFLFSKEEEDDIEVYEYRTADGGIGHYLILGTLTDDDPMWPMIIRRVR